MKCIYALVVVAGLAWAAPAEADGFGEAIVGLAAPLSDDTYTDAVDASLKLGLRVGAYSGHRHKGGLGFELGVDWTPMASHVDLFETESFHRVRVLGGLRLAYPATDRVTVVGRLAAGIDYTRASLGGQVLGVEFESTEDDIGIALDPSIAVQSVFGSTSVGVQFGLPIGIHDEQGDNFNIDYTSVDLDVLLVVTSRL